MYEFFLQQASLVLGKASVCIIALHGTSKDEFMCVLFVSKPKQGTNKVDVLSQIDNWIDIK